MHQFSLIGAPTLRVVEAAARFNMLIIVHTGGSSVASPWAVGALAERYPQARMIIDHMGGSDMEMVNSALEVAERHSNLYLGTSQMPFFRKYREAVARVGADRIIFGSDAPIVHPLPEFDRVRVANLGAEEERLIFGGNLVRLLNLREE
jgi:predicted TIM-barrel fold metal-dependent hydrolase